MREGDNWKILRILGTIHFSIHFSQSLFTVSFHREPHSGSGLDVVGYNNSKKSAIIPKSLLDPLKLFCKLNKAEF